MQDRSQKLKVFLEQNKIHAKWHLTYTIPKEGRAYIVNKNELIAEMAKKAGLSKKDTEKALKAFEDVVAEELTKDGKIHIFGFGTFEVASRSAREGRNPQTGKSMSIPASKFPKFKAGKLLKDAVNK